MRQSCPPKLGSLKRAWEEDLEGEIADKVWKELGLGVRRQGKYGLG